MTDSTLEFEDVRYEIETLTTGEAFAIKYVDGTRVQNSHFWSEQEARDWAADNIRVMKEYASELKN